MATRLPNAFSNFAHQCVCNEKASSLFFVRVFAEVDQRPHLYTHLTKTCKKSAEEAQDAVYTAQVATGFVVWDTETEYHILTCAHLFETFYSATRQITVEQLRNWFQVSVFCHHHEQQHIIQFPNMHYHPEVDNRLYSPATILQFDQHRDLMVLVVSRQSLYGAHNGTLCQSPHPRLNIATRIPKELDDVTMVAWPPSRDDSHVIGQVVNQSRQYGQISRDLSKGYRMSLMELDITGPRGFSGAPILNHMGRVVSVYHGRILSMGYGISADDIRHILFD